MMFSVFWVLLLPGFNSVTSQVTRSIMKMKTCSSASDFTLVYLIDGFAFAYPDFEKKRIVCLFQENCTMPGFYDYNMALADKQFCVAESEDLRTMENGLPDVKDPPVVSLYLKHFEEVGVANTLVCHLDQFYPPHVTVRWTRNQKDVTGDALMGHYLPKEDGSFHAFATLNFIVEEGDVYACSVEHQALDAPLTRTWELESSRPSMGPPVFCGLGLAVGLVGVAIGTTLFVKANQGR